VWELAFVIVARLLRAPSQRGWVALGVVLGIGLLNKLSVLWFGAGLLAGLLATPHRRLLLNRGPWLAGGIAVLLFLPHVLWQVAHGWPSAEFMQVATTRKMIPVSPAELFAQQALVWNPVVLPLWLAGFVALIARPRTDVGRVFAWVFVVTAAILIANGTSRPNYLALATPPLVAAGAIALERVCRRPRWGWAMPTALGLVAWTGLAGSPLTLPILPPEDLVRFQAAIGLGAPDMEGSESGRLDQHFADMIGWDAIVGSVADVYQTLPADERGRVAILTPDYASAAAIDRLGPARGLPPAISGHNSYWLWGPGKADGSVVLLVGGSRETWARHWGSLEEAATWDCGDCMAARNRQSVFVARQPRAPLAEMWPDLRHYD